MRLGQSSVSTSKSSRGFTAARALRTGRRKSKGAKKRASAPSRLERATKWPVRVVVDTTMRRPGKRCAQRAHQDPRRQHLAHRDGVDPDRGRSLRVQVGRQLAHALAEADAVLAGGASFPEEVGDGPHESNGEKSAVEAVHRISGPPDGGRKSVSIAALAFRFREQEGPSKRRNATNNEFPGGDVPATPGDCCYTRSGE